MKSKDLIHIDFNKAALETFQFQAANNPVYSKFIELLGVSVDSVTTLNQIPFMPISFFKQFEVCTGEFDPEIVFTSSGTTGMQTSKHFVKDLTWYRESYIHGFESFYGPVEDYVVLALLPAYLERTGSSLVYMVDDFIKRSKHEESGFYLNELSELAEKLQSLSKQKKKVLLIGVSFALLDLVEAYDFQLDSNCIVMETGGMKGRRKEMIREELHEVLRGGFGLEHIHSEYGMTELLSQAYSKGKGIFYTPSWMKVLIRDPEDALTLLPQGRGGGINVIDLANRYSCAFIATQDLGKMHADGGFEILGRFDNSDIRGCNLLVQ
ncbi:MAG: acyl transferase [Flavobacteriaceae bacterium]